MLLSIIPLTTLGSSNILVLGWSIIMKEQNILYNLLKFAKEKPNKIAVSLLNNDDINQIDQQITYKDLFQAVLQLAEWLKIRTCPGDRVILCYPTGIDFIVAFYACLWARVIAVAVIVPSNALLLNKFLSIYADCNPTLVLTDKNTQSLCEKSIHETPIFAPHMQQIEILSYCLPEILPDEIAFLQYTSGSTANPKGVMISHRNLMHNIVSIAKAFNSKEASVGVNWLPHTHDMGLIGSFLHSVFMGATLYLMSPFTIIRRPIAWLQALSKYRATITGGPCFMLKMCLDSLTEDKLNALDLRALEYIIVGSEMINADLVADFFDKLAKVGLSSNAFAPAYGLAEATLMVSARTGSLTHAAKNRQYGIVSCGKPYQNVKIVSLKTNTICPEPEVGEIWVDGLSIARGYWQNEQATALAFNARLDADSNNYFKTGDLGYIYQGELYLVGRVKDVIIINGVNYYPEDLERTIMSSDELMQHTSCAVFRWRLETHITDNFVVFIRASKRVNALQRESLILKIRKQLLKDYQLTPYDILFVNFSLPKTTSGKIKRHECAALFAEHFMQKELVC